MSLTERLSEPTPQPRRPRQGQPKGWENGVRYEGNRPVEAAITVTPAIRADETKWRAEIERVMELTIPEDREVTLTDARYWGNPDAPNVYCRFKISDRDGTGPGSLDIEDLIRVVKKAKAPKTQATATPKALVVAWADLQVGKVGSRGGTQELIERVMQKLDALDEHAKQLQCETVYLIDCGDCVESFENVPGQMFTNDLSFPEQLRVARRLFTEATIRLAKLHSRVVVASIPSNHGKWRRGKDELGRPGDDYGLETLITIADAFKLNEDAFKHVSFVMPDMWQETLALDVYGTILAVTHGHQVNRPEGVPQWWANQTHGGQPCADADILLTGHFHSARIQPTGRSAHTGRSKWWLQAPTLDNGSDWYRLRAGSDSDPGLMTFTVDANGWDGLKIL